MSAGWYVAREESGATTLPHQGRALLFAQYHLEEWTRAEGLAALKEFLSCDPAEMVAYLRQQGIAADEDDFAGESWYEPADALPTLEFLLARLDDDPGQVQSVEKVRGDLAVILEVVQAALAAGERFHLAAALPDLTGREPEAKQV